ncbi:MAG: GxxExxY protein [Deltaproteobacteria bacterium]|nr:GxxExxY protein [Deltaproteobacteria bacterium]MDL1986714.1 GxxExxY protein [Deltaproteobacteria bacterium]MDL2123240.1 GxxExxY protein [Deltaproteobacteria bacterium]
MSNLLYEDLSYKIIANIEIKAMKKIKNQDEAQLINYL